MRTMTREISNYDDIIDSRDIIARIGELEGDVERLKELEAQGPDNVTPSELDEWAPLSDQVADNADELATLRALASEGANSADDWEYGVVLIRESYFVTYAQELAEDIGAIDRDAPWPARHIDWDAAADELKVDYSEIKFDGVTYYVR